MRFIDLLKPKLDMERKESKRAREGLQDLMRHSNLRWWLDREESDEQAQYSLLCIASFNLLHLALLDVVEEILRVDSTKVRLWVYDLYQEQHDYLLKDKWGQIPVMYEPRLRIQKGKKKEEYTGIETVKQNWQRYLSSRSDIGPGRPA